MVLASSREPRPSRLDEHGDARAVVAWHDLECGRYRADLPLWRELASAAARAGSEQAASILDVGAGSGRVALDLARAGHRVSALERDAALLGALGERAVGLSVRALAGDARSFRLRRRDFALCLVPMQTVQLLGGARGRGAFLRQARAHLRAGGLLACAIVTELEPFDCAHERAGPAPETMRVEGTLYISRPLRVQVRRRSIRIERERLLVPAGRALQSAETLRERDVVELDRVSAAELEREGRAAGLRPEPARTVAATEDHVGSTVVMLRA